MQAEHWFMRGVFRNLIFSITFLFIINFGHLSAQEPISVIEAVQLGLKNNFDAQIQMLEVEQAKRLNEWGQAGALPTINFSTNQNNSIIERKPANPFAVAGRNISNNIPGNLEIQWTLFNGYAIRLNKARLDQLEQQSEGNARVILESTVQTIVLAYYNVLLEQQRLEVRKKAVQFSKQLYDYVRLKKDLGGAITFDVLQQQNNFLTDSANVLRQELAVKSAKRNMNELLNEPLDKDYLFLDDFAYTPVERRYEYETLRAKMLSSNANLRNQYIIQELQRIARQSLESSMYPSLSLSLGSSGSLDQLNARFRPTANGTVIKNTIGYLNDDDAQPVISRSFAPEYRTLQGYSYGAFANLTLRFTLFNGGQIKRAVKNAEIDQRIIQLGTDKLKLSLENDLLTFLEQYHLRRQLAAIASTKLRAAELNLNLGYERYRNGSFSAIDLRIIEENFQNAALENYAAIFDVLSVKTDLIRLTGGLLDDYR